jgi:flagellar biosynthetic protein FliR
MNVALPLIASGLLGEVAMGFIIRTVPQMNVFVVGIPLKIILGFLILLLVLPVYVQFTGEIFKHLFASIEKMLGGLA